MHAREVKRLRPTIHDVARAAGVSIATVSKVLNETGRISASTRQKVFSVAQEMGYEPSAIATALVGKNTHTIGLVLPDINNPYFSEIVRGAEDEAYARGYSVLICNTDHDERKEQAYLRTLRLKQMDGIAIATGSTPLATIDELVGEGMKVVLLARNIPGSTVGVVTVDNFQGGYMAARHLLDCGHCQIGYVSEPLHIASSRERLAGFEQGLREEGCVLAALEAEGFGVTTGARLAERILSSHSGRAVTALFAANDQLAVGALQACRSLGVSVPENLSIVGFDDTILAEIVTPPLTTISQPMYALGKNTIGMLVDAIESSEQPTEQRILQPRLVVRASTAKRQ